jgi:ubiquinone/menaquinone biosynthesis C-methylase UbiE
VLPLAILAHPEARAVILPRATRAADFLFFFLDSRRRKRAADAQYENTAAPVQYALMHHLPGPNGRHVRARLALIGEILADHPAGQLLDAGCGAGILARSLLLSPRHDFSITVADRSPAMVKYCVDTMRDLGKVRAYVGDLERLPFADATFDVTLATGALEYTDAAKVLHEFARVTRRNGTVIVSMLNPASPYRLVEWFLYWPALRFFEAAQRHLRFRTSRPHGAEVSGIRAQTVTGLRKLMRQAGLRPTSLIYYDLTPLVPPLDRIPALQRWTGAGPRARGWKRWLGTGYVLVAQRA